MMRTLTLAIEAYDRHMAFHLGTVKPLDGIALQPLDVGMIPPGKHGGNRHARMLRDHEFDIAEVSFSSYVLAKSKGAAFTGVPVFPRRLFSQNHMFVNVDAGIRTPRDLAGKRIAIRTPQVTMSVLARGDLTSEYGVDLDDVTWVLQHEDVISWTPPPGMRIERLSADQSAEEMLIAGDVDAFIDPRPSETILTGTDRVKSLFDDPRAESMRAFAKRGCYPLMHLIAIKDEVAQEFPALARDLIDVFEDAKEKMRELYVDFAWGLSPFGRYAYQDDEVRFGRDPYPSGIAANRDNLDWFIGYHVDQHIIPRRLSLEELFHPSVLDT